MLCLNNFLALSKIPSLFRMVKTRPGVRLASSVGACVFAAGMAVRSGSLVLARGGLCIREGRVRAPATEEHGGEGVCYDERPAEGCRRGQVQEGTERSRGEGGGEQEGGAGDGAGHGATEPAFGPSYVEGSEARRYRPAQGPRAR